MGAMVDDASLEPPTELSAEEIAQARDAFDATFRQVAAGMLAARRKAAGPPPHGLAAVGRLLLDISIAGLAGALAGVKDGLGAIYDGRPSDCVFGTPMEARAWRALRDEGDAEFFLQVYGHRSGLEAINDKLAGLADLLAGEAQWQDAERHEPEAQEAAARPRFGDESDQVRPATFDAFSIPELKEWVESVISALDTVRTWRLRLREEELAALARGKAPDPELEAVAQLTDADLLVLALKGDSPRGYARGDRREQRRLEYIERRRKRLMRAVVE